ncbi:MAG: hypothetical protein PHI34_00280 [Acidobacteriota bacterium]|nr:hypothetical protein [Acidobacteriota bacterium]
MKRALVPLILALLALTAVPAAADMASFRLSFNIPTMRSDFWTNEFTQLTLTRKGFQETSFGLAYELFLTREISLVLGLDIFARTKSGMYRDYVAYSLAEGEFAFPDNYYGDYIPTHTIRYSVTPIQLSVKLTPLGRRAGLIPYVGGGIAVYFYNLRRSGDVIDFDNPSPYTDAQGNEVRIYPISDTDDYESSFGRFGFGYQVFGGLMIPIGDQMTIDGGIQFNRGQAKLKSFPGFEPLDLGGFLISIGFNYWF